MQHRKEGFPEEVLIVLPQTVADTASGHPLLGGILPVAAGYFPKAQGHLVERDSPIPEAIFILCCDGCGWVSVNGGKRERVERDCLVYIPPNVPHAYGADERAPWSIYWFHARGTEVGAYAELLGVSQDAPLLRLEPDAAAQFHFSGILQPLSRDYTVAHLLTAATQVRVVLTEVFRHKTRGRPAAQDPVVRTIEWMQAHLSEKMSLAQLARLAGLSPTRYSAVFRERTGYSPVDYLIRLRVQHAAQLLDRTPMRVEAVANAVGYEDAFYFSRLFRRIMGQSPREYRATKKG